MEIHYSDLLFIWLQNYDPNNFTLTETSYGIKVVEWLYDDDKLFVAIFSFDNQLIAYHFE